MPNKRYQFNLYKACGIVEGFEPCRSKSEYRAAWQWLIDTGHCWQLQGFYGRTAISMIESGECHETPEQKKQEQAEKVLS